MPSICACTCVRVYAHGALACGESKAQSSPTVQQPPSNTQSTHCHTINKQKACCVECHNQVIWTFGHCKAVDMTGLFSTDDQQYRREYSHQLNVFCCCHCPATVLACHARPRQVFVRHLCTSAQTAKTHQGRRQLGHPLCLRLLGCCSDCRCCCRRPEWPCCLRAAPAAHHHTDRLHQLTWRVADCCCPALCSARKLALLWRQWTSALPLTRATPVLLPPDQVGGTAAGLRATAGNGCLDHGACCLQQQPHSPTSAALGPSKVAVTTPHAQGPVKECRQLKSGMHYPLLVFCPGNCHHLWEAGSSLSSPSCRSFK